MTLNEIKLGTLVHYTPRIIAVLLAVFFVGGNISHATPQGQSIYCASEDGRRHYCGVDTRGGVTLARQHSDASCIKGQTWGYDRGGVWVDRGCRADFVTGGERGGYDRGRDYGRDREYGRGGGGGGGGGGCFSTLFFRGRGGGRAYFGLEAPRRRE